MKIIHVFSYYASVCETEEKERKKKNLCFNKYEIKVYFLNKKFLVRFPSFLLSLFSPLKFLYVNGKKNNNK